MKTPLFLHLSTFVPSLLCSQSNTSALHKVSKAKTKFTMPIPIVSALAGGQLLIGKLRFREFCFTPLSGSPFPEQIKMLAHVHGELGKVVQGKSGVIHYSEANTTGYQATLCTVIKAICCSSLT